MTIKLINKDNVKEISEICSKKPGKFVTDGSYDTGIRTKKEGYHHEREP